MTELDELLNTFSGRRPSLGFGRNGPQIRGFRSRPGAPQADPTSNLPMSGKSGTPDSVWNRWFKSTARPGAATPEESEPQGANYVPGMPADFQPGSGTDDTAAGGGIAQQTIDGAFGAGHWSRMLGRTPSRVPDLMSPAPFMPGQQGVFRGAPKSLTGPLGNNSSDRAGLAANLGLYAPGGMTGLWSTPRREQWEAPSFRTATDIARRYQTRA